MALLLSRIAALHARRAFECRIIAGMCCVYAGIAVCWLMETPLGLLDGASAGIGIVMSYRPDGTE
jgi:hypothetical protein